MCQHGAVNGHADLAAQITELSLQGLTGAIWSIRISVMHYYLTFSLHSRFVRGQWRAQTTFSLTVTAVFLLTASLILD